MRYSEAGRPRRITDEQARKIREWKPLAALAKEMGITQRMAWNIRQGYHFKQRSP